MPRYCGLACQILSWAETTFDIQIQIRRADCRSSSRSVGFCWNQRQSRADTCFRTGSMIPCSSSVSIDYTVFNRQIARIVAKQRSTFVFLLPAESTGSNFGACFYPESNSCLCRRAIRVHSPSCSPKYRKVHQLVFEPRGNIQSLGVEHGVAVTMSPCRSESIGRGDGDGVKGRKESGE